MKVKDSPMQELTKLVEIQIETIANDAKVIQELQMQLRQKDDEIGQLKEQQVTVDTSVDINKLQEELAYSLRENTELKEELAYALRDEDNMQQVLANPSREVEDLENKYREKSEEVADLRRELRTKSDENSDLQGKLQEQSAMINDLQNQLRQSNDALSQRTESSNKITTLKDEISKMKKENSGLKSQVHEQSETITNLQKQLKAKEKQEAELTALKEETTALKSKSETSAGIYNTLSELDDLLSMRSYRNSKLEKFEETLREETYLHKVYEREFEYLKDFCEIVPELFKEELSFIRKPKLIEDIQKNASPLARIVDIRSKSDKSKVHKDFKSHDFCLAHYEAEYVKNEVVNCLTELQAHKLVTKSLRSDLISLLQVVEYYMLHAEKEHLESYDKLANHLKSREEMSRDFLKSILIIPYDYKSETKSTYFEKLHPNGRSIYDYAFKFCRERMRIKGTKDTDNGYTFSNFHGSIED